jgi:hypothetical protein
VSYDVTPAPEGADPVKWAAHQGGTCGGYYKCGFCAAIVAREKARLEAQHAGPGAPRRAPTQTVEDSARARRAHRQKRKAERAARNKARKLQRKRMR